MQKDQWVAAEEICAYYQIDYAFITSLKESGLVDMESRENKSYIPMEQLRELEKFTRLHYELEINLEGIEAIAHLLARIKDMQLEIANLKKAKPGGPTEGH
ncbi:MAG: hypothetical protein NVS9B7_01310 [Flavisolibacter sp.]